MSENINSKSTDFYLQIIFIAALFLVFTLFFLTRFSYFYNSSSSGSGLEMDLFKNDPYRIELELNRKKNDLATFQTDLAKKYTEYRQELKNLNQLNISDLEKKQRKSILENTYSEDFFEILKAKINLTLKEIQTLEASRCSLSCGTF